MAPKEHGERSESGRKANQEYRVRASQAWLLLIHFPSLWYPHFHPGLLPGALLLWFNPTLTRLFPGPQLCLIPSFLVNSEAYLEAYYVESCPIL